MKITNVNDYVEKVHEKFPELSENEIRRILIYGWKMIIKYVSSKNDILIQSKEIFCFIGRIPKDSLKAFEIYYHKLANRISFMFQRTKSEWDGYYYFSRSENQYIDYLKQKRRKNKIFKNVFLYKLLEELKVREPYNPYIFRLDENITDKSHKYYPEIKTDKAELVIQRDPLKMQDLMVSNNKYKYIQ